MNKRSYQGTTEYSTIHKPEAQQSKAVGGSGSSQVKGPSNKALLILLLAILLALVITAAVVFGRNAVINQDGQAQPAEEPQREGTYILYNGKEYKYDDSRINLLFLGIDKDLPMEEARTEYDMGLADAILLVSLDGTDKTMDIIAIPRETMTAITQIDKDGNPTGIEETVLTFQYAYGKTAQQSGELMLQAVSRLMHGIPIQKYCAVNFNAIPLLNDEVGGVEVEVLENLTNLHPEFIQGNTVHLNGQMAFDYVHYRDTGRHGTTITRMDRQKQYIMAYLQKMKTFGEESIESLYDLYERLGENMSANITTEDMVALTNTFSEITMEDIEQQRIPSEIRTGEDYDVYYDMYIADDEALKKMIIDIFYEEVKEGTHNE